MDDKPKPYPDPDAVQRSFDIEPEEADKPQPLPMPTNQPPKPAEKPRRFTWLVIVLWAVALLCLGPILLIGAIKLQFAGATDPIAGLVLWMHLLPVYAFMPYFAWPGVVASALLIIFDGNIWRKILACLIAAAFSMGLLMAHALSSLP